ncbi:MAG: hypothetical protein EOP04_32860, partial [Proteobacteria bacterium]
MRKLGAWLKGRWFGLTLLVLALLKLYLVANLRADIIPHSDYDDWGFVAKAFFILKGQWLGAYNYITLYKGPIYPIFLALSSKSGLSFLISQHLLYLGMSTIVSFGLRRLKIHPAIVIFTFLLLIFNPITWSLPNLRSVRDLFFTCLVIGWFGLIFLSLSKVFDRKKNAVAWSFGLGLYIVILWYTREEGILILPSLAFSLAILFFRLFQTMGIKKATKYGAFLTLGITLGFLSGKTILSQLNVHFYGTHHIIDSTTGPYMRAYRSMTALIPPKSPLRDPIPASVRAQLRR